MLGRIGQGVAQIDAVVGAAHQLGVHPGVAAEHLPLVGDVARHAQFQTLHPGLARLLIAVRRHQNGRVLAGQVEQGAAERQAIAEQISLGADLEALGFLRVENSGDEVGAAVGRARVLIPGRDGRRRRGGRPGGVDAAVRRRLIDQADLIVDEVPVAARGGVDRRRNRARGVQPLDRIVVPAQAQVQDKPVVQADGVEGVDAHGVRVRAADQTARLRARPRIVRIGGVDRGAVQPRQRRRAGRAGQGRDRIGGVPVLLARQLNADVEVVLDRPGQERAVQVGDVGQGLGRVPARLQAPLHPPDAVDLLRRAAVAGVGDDVVVQRLRIAGDVAQGQIVAEAVLDLQRQAVDRIVQIVARLQAVEAVVRHVQHARGVRTRRRRPAQLGVKRDAVIRQLVAVEVVVAGGDGRRRAQARRDRGADAPLVEIGAVAARHVALRGHEVQAHGGGRPHLPVGVHRATQIIVRADPGRGVDEVGQARRLGRQIDAAAARAPARVDGIGALDDLDLLQIEDLALLTAGVADAVDEDVVARGLAPDEGPVGQGLAALARAEGDAGRGAQDILQRGGGGLFDDLLRNHRHGARRIDQGGDELRVLRLALHAMAVHVNRAQMGGVLADHAVGGRSFVGNRRHRGRGAQHPGGAGREQKRLEGGGASVRAGVGHWGRNRSMIETGSH